MKKGQQSTGLQRTLTRGSRVGVLSPRAALGERSAVPPDVGRRPLPLLRASPASSADRATPPPAPPGPRRTAPACRPGRSPPGAPREDVPGMSSVCGETARTQARHDLRGRGAASRGDRDDARAARSASPCPGKPEPSGKNGTNAMPCCSHRSSTGWELRSTRLNGFCTHTTGVRVSACRSWSAVTFDRPTPAISPSSRAWTIASSCSSNGTPVPWPSSSRRRLTAPSCGTSRLARLSSMPCRSSSGRSYGSQPPFVVAPRADLAHQDEARRRTGAAPPG